MGGKQNLGDGFGLLVRIGIGGDWKFEILCLQWSAKVYAVTLSSATPTIYVQTIMETI